MHSIVYKLGLFLFASIMAVMMVGCEEALTDSTTEGIPNTSGGDTTGTPFVTIVSGSEGNPLVGTAGRLGVGLYGAQPFRQVSLEVQPNFAVQDDIVFEYSVSGTATEGQDFTIATPNPDTIVYDVSNTSIDDKTIDVVGGGTPQGGFSLTTETRLVEVTLTSASVVGDGREVLVGRGGSDVGTSRTVAIGPSISLVSTGFAPLSGVSVPETTVGDTTSTTTFLLNTSRAPFEATNVSLSGADADQFSVASVISNPIAPGEGLESGNFPLIQVSFIPTSEGEKTAVLSLDVSNSSDNTTAEYPVTGTAVSE